jgi:hypothetical protein
MAPRIMSERDEAIDRLAEAASIPRDEAVGVVDRAVEAFGLDAPRDLVPELDGIEARLHDRLSRLPALDEREPTDQYADGVTHLLRAMKLFEDADDVTELASYYCLVWAHKFGPAWHESVEALSVLGRYDDAHTPTLAREVVPGGSAELAGVNVEEPGRFYEVPFEPLAHTRAYYRNTALLEEHLTVAHGFDEAGSWPTGRLLAAS